MTRVLLIAGAALLLLAAAFGAGYWAAPGPTVTFHAVEVWKDRVVEKPVEVRAEDPSRTTTVIEEFNSGVRAPSAAAPIRSSVAPAVPATGHPPTPAPGRQPDRVTTIVEERGQVVTIRGAEAVRERSGERQVSTTAPAPARASWAVSGGLVVLPGQLPVFGVGRRLVGPFWAQLDVAPSPLLRGEIPHLALQLRAEF